MMKKFYVFLENVIEGHGLMRDQPYLVIEYQICHQKISNAVDHLIRIEIYLFLGIAALYAWFYAAVNASTPLGEGIELVLYLPTLLAILAFYRSFMQIKYIASVAQYLMLIEENLANSGSSDGKWAHIGFETWFEKNGPRTWNYVYRLLLWLGLIIGTLVVAYLRIGVP